MMRKPFGVLLLSLALLGGLAVLAACAAIPSILIPVSSSGAAPTPVISGETPTPAPTGANASGQRSVTLADDGATIHLKVGERFLLNLGEGYDWTPVVADQHIVSRVIGVMVIRGAQGLYRANAPGVTTLTVTGDPACRQSTPPCMMPSRVVTVKIVVE